MIKPKVRIWDQSGLKNLVTVTAPKKEEKEYTDNLSQGQVKSRLHALADTLDSRGWAAKNANVNMYAHPGYTASRAVVQQSSDRLVAPQLAQKTMPIATEVQASDDMLDYSHNKVAQNFERMINESTQQRKQEAISNMQRAANGGVSTMPQTPDNYWFATQEGHDQSVNNAASTHEPTVLNQPLHAAMSSSIKEETELMEILRSHKRNDAYERLKKIEPLSDEHKSSKNEHKKETAHGSHHAKKDENKHMTAETQPAILELANNSDDLSVATLAKQAKRAQLLSDDDEVVISLH